MNVVRETVERRSSQRRFSVREAALATVAIGLLAALAVEHQPWTKAFWKENFPGSDFLNEFTEVAGSGEDSVVAPICGRLVSQGKAECYTGGYGGRVGGRGKLAQLSASFRLRTPGVKPGTVVLELRREVEQRLTEHGFSVDESEYPTDDCNDNQGFRFHYSKGRIIGFVIVYPFASKSFDPEKDAWRLEISFYEHHRGGYFGW